MAVWIRRNLALLGGVTVLVAACSLPERDNALDPVNAPVARLQVVDASASETDRSCVAVEGSASLPSILSAGRGRCLVLDARDSSDPNGDPLFYRFVVSTGGIDIAVTGSGGYAVLPSSLKTTLTPGTTITASVFVRDRTPGPESRADRDFVLENSPASLKPVKPRAFPAGGFGWARGEPFSVSFESEVLDPDGPDEPREYCWTFPDPFPDSSATPVCSTSPDFTKELPVTPATYVASLVVRDAPGSESNRVHAVVHVRERAPWALYATPALQAIARVDTLEQTFAMPNWEDGSFVRGNPDSLALANGSGVRLVQLPDLVTLHTEPLTACKVRTVADASRNRLWLFVAETCGAVAQALTGRFESWTLAEARDDVEAIEASPVIGPLPSFALQYDGIVLAVDEASGDLFASSLGAREYYQVFADGTLLAVPLEGVTAGLSRRADGTVWLLEAPDPLDPVATSSQLRPLSGQMQAVEVPDHFVPSIFAWVDQDRFWLLTRDAGLLLVSDGLLREGVSLQDASLLQLGAFWDPFIALNASWRVEPHTGTLWIPSTTSVVGVTTRGEQRTELADSRALLFEDGGIAWAGTGIGIRRGFSPGTGAYFQQAAVEGYRAALPEHDGGIALLTDQPVQLLRYGIDGQLAEQVTSARDGSVPVSLQSSGRALLSADGRSLWNFDTTANLVQHVDLVTGAARTSAVEADLFPLGASVDALGPPFLWVARHATGEILTLDTSGQATLLHTVPPEYLSSFIPGFDEFNSTQTAAVSPVSNRLCLVVDSSGIGHGMWIDPDGTVTELEETTVNRQVRSIVTTWDDADEYCWSEHHPVSGLDGSDLVVWSGSGARLHDVVLPVTTGSLAAFGRNVAWITPIAFPTRPVYRLELDPTPGGGLDTVIQTDDYGTDTFGLLH